MSLLTKRTTIYLEQELHQALRMKSAETNRSISELVNELVREQLFEDAEDLKAFRDRADEPVVSYEALLQDLQAHDKL
ncbi:MAG: CopG family transcriptional regulator [Chloroflexi bacterium]|nr:CopG family transcriptional regulator [Chloroflexota bacterium]